MRALNIAIGVVVFASGVVRAQEPPPPSPSPSNAPVPKALAPKLRVPVLPTTVAPGTGPIVPVTGDAQPKRARDVPSVATSARPVPRVLPGLPVRLPGAARPAEADQSLPRLSLEAISVINGKPV